MAAAAPRFAEVEKTLEQGVLNGYVSGTVALTWKAGEGVHSYAVGMRDIEGGKAMQKDTLFRIASMTKPLTTVLALQLLDEGKLALSDPISKWLPGFADPPV